MDVRASFSLYRLTITDSDGATNSTTATLIIHGAVDYPPVANAGPNQTITLPQNTITLNGNQSSDDHQIVLYEWSPGPGGESKEVVMQASPLSCLQTFILSLSVCLWFLSVYPSIHHLPIHHPSVHASLGYSNEGHCSHFQGGEASASLC